MSPIRIGLLGSLLLGLTTGSSLEGQQTPSPAPPAPPAPTDKPAEKPARTRGDQLLDQAIESLTNRSWLGTHFRQKVFYQGIKLEAEGRFVSAPGWKVYYELQTRIGREHGLFLVVCDGQNLWRVEQVGDEPKSIQKYEIAALKEALGKDEAGDELERQVDRLLREAAHNEHGFSGLRAMLEDLKSRLTFTSVEPTTLTLNGQGIVPVFRLDGEWTKQFRERFAPPRKPDSPPGPDRAEQWEKRAAAFLFVPRQCRLYLARDAWWPWSSSFWPYRIEWLGPIKVGGPDELLLTLEFRNPVIGNPPVDGERIFELKLTPAEEKLVQAADPREAIKNQRAMLVRQRQAEQQAQSLRPLDPADIGAPLPGPKQPLPGSK